MHITKTLRRSVKGRRTLIAAADWCRKTFGERSSTLFMALLIGVLAAFGVALMHVLVETFSSFSGRLERFSGSPLLKGAAVTAFFFLPLAGLFLSHCVQHKWGGRNSAKSYKELAPIILKLCQKLEPPHIDASQAEIHHSGQ